ncbi:MAG TPA: hypothetical protein VL326_34580 [Kofleriaceae bacterium]|jgi:hypothetical protein|nr:hypothetical protein [Kofleriaceae bacterium]
MAEEKDPGAPIPKDAIDPELIKLARKQTHIGVVTCAGVIFLALFFIIKLNADRRFGGASDTPASATPADIADGKVTNDQLVSVQGELMMAHAVRVGAEKKSLGLRVVPLRGTAEKVWVVLDGDGYAKPTMGSFTGRLRDLDDLPFAHTVRDYVAAHPQPVFATAAATRAGFSSNKVASVAGDQLDVRDSDRVGFEIVDASAATVVCTFNEKHENLAACTKELQTAGIPIPPTPREGRDQAYYDVTGVENAVATMTTKLEAAKLWGTRVDAVTRHYDTTWAKLKTSSPAGFTVDTTTIPDAQIDLIGLYVVRSIPANAHAVILGEHPQDYWYVMPVTVLLSIIGLLFAWALVRAVKRDLLGPKPAPEPAA